MPTDQPAATNQAPNHATQNLPGTSANRAAANHASANQANAQHSTGPRTDEGKARSSQNALRHGLASGKIIIAGEDPAEFDVMHEELITSFCPSNIAERMLLEQMAQQWWLMQRALRLQQEAFASAAPGALPSQLALLIRYHSAAERAYHRALKSLLDMRKASEQTVFRMMALRRSSGAPDPASVAAAHVSAEMEAEFRMYMETQNHVATPSHEHQREPERQSPRPVRAA